MTSLSRQLESLRTAETAQLGTEKVHTSLLFERKDARTLTAESALEIGKSGIAELRKIDKTFAEDEEELFDDAAIGYQRLMMSKEENERLNVVIDRIIMKLTPYFNLYSAKKVLEWLIFRFQIHAFNTNTLFVTFLLYHNTNSFGRLLSILNLKGREFDWLRQYAQEELAVPFQKLVTMCFSRNHSLLMTIQDHIERVAETFAVQYVETKMSFLFNFYTSLCVHVVESSNMNDEVLSHIFPFVGKGLVSKIRSLRLACLMIISQLCLSIQLVSDKLNALTKLVLLKFDALSARESVDVFIVICQRQNITSFPSSKIARKFMRRACKFNLIKYIDSLYSITDMRSFVNVCCHSYIPMLKNTDDEEKCTEIISFLESCVNLTILDEESVAAILSLMLELISESNDPLKIPNSFWNYVRAAILRFPSSFNSARSEWEVRDVSAIDFIIKNCRLEGLEVVVQEKVIERKKRRRRRSSTRNSLSQEDENKEEKQPIKKKKNQEIKEEQLKAVREPQKVIFTGDPIEKLIDTIHSQQWELCLAGLEKLTSDDYVNKRVADDFEELIIKMINVALRDGGHIKASIRSALTDLPMNAEFAKALLSGDAFKKKSKRIRRGISNDENLDVIEDEDFLERRQILVLEILKSNKKISRSGVLLGHLFARLLEVLRSQNTNNEEEIYKQRLLIGSVTEILKNPQGYKVVAGDLQLSCVVDLIRNTQNHIILRDCLQLLIAAVSISPSTLFSNLMSVFTFMGSGLLRKDNALTLSIIEEALNVLFSVVIDEKNKNFHEHLVSVCRLFAQSAIDIPAHRRQRILRVIARSATADYLWVVIAVLFEHFCLTWQKCDAARSRAVVELYEEMAKIMCSVYDFEQQLSCAIDLVKYIIELGGDREDASDANRNTSKLVTIFDRTKHSLQKLRHHRFAILGVIARLLSSDEFLAELGSIDVGAIYDRLLAIAKRLLLCSMELNVFITEESTYSSTSAIKDENSAAVRDQSNSYWSAVSSRAEVIIDKFQNLLPVSVCSELVSNLLQQSATSPQLRDQSLQFLNSKLLQVASGTRNEEYNRAKIDNLVANINPWLRMDRNTANISLCQSAAFTLKLIARTLPPSANSAQLSESLEISSKMLNEWNSHSEIIIGNLLLLVGELMRFNRVKNGLIYVNPIVCVCIDILSRSNDESNTTNISENLQKGSLRLTRRLRAQQHSISAYFGNNMLSTCSLICLQRVVESYSGLISKHLVDVLVTIGRLSSSCSSSLLRSDEENHDSSKHSNTKPSNVLRLENISKALAKMELRIVLDPFKIACEQLHREPAAIGVLFKLLSIFDQLKNRTIILKHIQHLRELFLIGFETRSKNDKVECLEAVSGAELQTINSFLEVIDHLSENEFRSIAASIHEWQKLALVANADKRCAYRLLTVFNFLNRFYDVYRDLAIPHFGTFFDSTQKILTLCNRQSTGTSEVLLHGKKGSLETKSANMLLTSVIDFITKCAHHPHFFTVERCKYVLDSLIAELDNSDLEGHEVRCVPHLADCFCHMADARSEMLSEIINKIMLKTRSRSKKVRYRTLLVLERTFDRMGDAVSPVLPTILPILSELLEDDDERVEMQCDKVIVLLRKKFGEIMNSYA